MTATMETETMSIAKTIADQIGGRAFFMMGAKNITDTGNGLDFKICRNAKGVTHVSIVLNEMDLYDIEFVRCNVRAKEMRKVIEFDEDVYADMMHDIISAGTGMALSQGTMGR